MSLQPPIDKKVAIALPVYNEGPVLQSVIQSLAEKHFIVIVVDDGSHDPVSIPDISPVILLRHAVNLGQGASLQTAFEYARRIDADIVVTFDADGQHDVNEISTLIAPLLSNEADIVLGSRFLSRESTGMTFQKKLLLKTARLINFVLSGMFLTDAHNGLRALNRKALHSIFITENRMAHASEILFEIKKHKLRWKEVPVHIRYSDYSRTKGQSGWESIKILFDLVLHKLFK